MYRDGSFQEIVNFLNFGHIAEIVVLTVFNQRPLFIVVFYKLCQGTGAALIVKQNYHAVNSVIYL